MGDRSRTNSFSKRAARGKLDVIRRDCPFCGHHKALRSVTLIKCSRCKKRLD
jgi:ribosomal protein L37AE/L43A